MISFALVTFSFYDKSDCVSEGTRTMTQSLYICHLTGKLHCNRCGGIAAPLTLSVITLQTSKSRNKGLVIGVTIRI